MERYDCVFLGNGPTAIAVMGYYQGKPFKGRYLMIAEPADPEGAIYKGVKTVNLIVPKLPNIILSTQAQNKYQQVVKMLRLSESTLEATLSGIPAFQGISNTGYRLCKTMEELNVLKKLTDTGSRINDSLDLAVVSFIEKTLGSKIDKDKLFSYQERVWDVSAYINYKTDKIPQNKIWSASKIKLEESKNMEIVLEVTLDSGTTEIISAGKVIVCKGAGNIQFEKDIINTLEQSISAMPFSVLPMAKLVYEGYEPMPESISSIMLPEPGICVTNEALNTHSLLYNTNVQPIKTDKFDSNFYNNSAQNIHTELKKMHTALPDKYSKVLNCSMTVDPHAYGTEYLRHFQFIKSSSVLSNIYYLNLPYFSVIETALLNLPPHIKDFK